MSNPLVLALGIRNLIGLSSTAQGNAFRDVIYVVYTSSVPTLVEQKQLVIGSDVVFARRDSCK
jgi:hypothetical protein